MPEFTLKAASGDLIMSLPASMPLFTAAEGQQQARAGVEDEQVHAQDPGCGFSPTTAAVVGFAALVMGSAPLFLRSRRIRSALKQAELLTLNRLEALEKDERLCKAIDKLKRDDPEQLRPEMDSLFARISHIYASDHGAASRLGQVGPSYLLYQYYKESGYLWRAHAAARAVYFAYDEPHYSLGKAAEIHAKLARGVRKLVSKRKWEAVFARAMHSMTAAQLFYRRAIRSRGLEEQIAGLRSAYGMVCGAESAIAYLSGGWVNEQAVRGAGQDPNLRDEVTAVMDVGQTLKGYAKNRLYLISDPADALEEDIRMERRKRDWTGGHTGSGGTGSVRHIKGPLMMRNRQRGGPDSSAMSSLSAFRPALLWQAPAGRVARSDFLRLVSVHR